jgi:leucyl aminopeptidase (aminopeptidase T)
MAEYDMPGWCRNLIEAGRMRPDEEVLVFVDEPLLEQGMQLAAAVKEAGGRPTFELWAGERPMATAPPPILAAAERVTLAYFLSKEPHPAEAPARFQVGETMLVRGGREIYMGFITPELLEGELSQPSVDLQEPARRLLDELEGSETVTIRGAAGTDLTLTVKGRPWKTDAVGLGDGDFANYPGGEIFIAPLKDGADGVLVADLTVPYTVDGLVDEPVTLRFEQGRVMEISGGKAAQMLREIVADAGTGADVIAELGIGLNPAVKPRGHVMLDEKAANTAHVAIGKNTGTYGGDNDAAIHVDCIFSAPEVEVDGRRLDLPAVSSD